MNSLVHYFESKQGQRTKNIIIGLGAAVVILGALFKLMSWPFAGTLLIIGLGTEAFLFTLLGILPPHPDLYWEKFYPGITEAPHEGDKAGKAPKPVKSVTDQLNDMLEKSNMDSVAIERLGNNLGKLGETASKISEVGGAVAATNEYTNQTKAAAEALAKMQSAYANATTAVNSLAATTNEFKGYQDQIQSVAKNLAQLNSLYEVELQGTTGNLKALNRNLAALNNVYGNMLGAMGFKQG